MSEPAPDRAQRQARPAHSAGGSRATTKQQKELRRLAERTGTAFTYPQTTAEASREIERMRKLPGQHRSVARAEVRDVSVAIAGPRQASDFQERETTGYGSSARWADDSSVGSQGGPVVHMRRARYDVRIDRETRWGNPYKVGRDGTVEQVIELYRKHLWKQIETGEVSRRELAKLDGKVLGCWCAPGPCHGDVLTAAASWASREIERPAAVEPTGGPERKPAATERAAPEASMSTNDSLGQQGAGGRVRSGSREAHIDAAIGSPGSHLTDVLGESPESPTLRRGWERAVRAIEGYRFDNAVSASELLGPKPAGGAQRCRFQAVEAELVRGQRVLGRDTSPSLVREI